MNLYHTNSRRWSSQRGQAFLAIVMFIAILLLAVLGLATDYTQVWAHRQMAQGAADAACQAGAADVFLKGTDPTASADFPGLDFSWIGSTFDCSAMPNSVPCQYALFNGYSGSNVSVSFPSNLAGVSGIPSGFPTIGNPYIKVTVTDPVAMYFTKIVSSTKTVNVTASAGCGLSPVTTPVPLVVLHRTASPSFQINSNASVTMLGGPPRSIQVDSSSSTAVTVGTVDLHLAGPGNNGAPVARLPRCHSRLMAVLIQLVAWSLRPAITLAALPAAVCPPVPRAALCFLIKARTPASAPRGHPGRQTRTTPHAH